MCSSTWSRWRPRRSTATVGGVSVRPHDPVRLSLTALGAREVFGRVSLRSGGQICFFLASRSEDAARR